MKIYQQLVQGSGAITSSGNISGVNITGTGTTHTLGTIEIAGNVIRSTDSTSISINDSLKVGSITGNLTILIHLQIILLLVVY